MSAENLFQNIPNHWEVTTLGDLAKKSGGGIQTGPFGSQLHASDYVEDGIPSIMPKNITVDAVTTDDIACVSAEDVARLSKYKVQAGDIVYSRRGDVEKCARITEKEDGWLCGTGCLRVRVKPSSVSAEYLHAYLCHPAVREWIVRHAVGATMPNLNTSILSNLPVVIPGRTEMAFISSVWLTISEKIQINHQINQTLEQMAQAIFKSWFVDFEPVKAKMAAKESWLALQPAAESASPVCYAEDTVHLPDLETWMNLAAMQVISGQTEEALNQMADQQPEQFSELFKTAALFPAAMQDSELGEIPEGWVVSQIGDEVTSVGGTTPSTKNPAFWEGGEINWTSPKDLSSLAEKVLISTERKITEEGLKKISSGLLPENTVLMSSRAPVGYLVLTKIPVAINQGYIAMKCNKTLTPEFVLQWCSTNMDEIKGRASGTTFAEISKSNFRLIPVVVPHEELVLTYSKQVSSIYGAVESNVRESASLASLRDTLLPKLLSGELSVADFELEETADV